MGEKLAINDYGGLGRGHSGAFRGYETSGEVLGVWEDSRASERVLKIGCMLNTACCEISTDRKDYRIISLMNERKSERRSEMRSKRDHRRSNITSPLRGVKDGL